ncbi:MAG: MoaD/ThiS family protein [Mariprofundaceae bacterium]|nr:MoaD/ThiS family protein [Mariprofundaceae bacterium]
MNKTVKVIFFGLLAEQVGHKSIKIQSGKTLADVIAEVGCADIQPLLVAVNQELVKDFSLILNDGDEVALMPPFSGG